MGILSHKKFILTQKHETERNRKKEEKKRRHDNRSQEEMAEEKRSGRPFGVGVYARGPVLLRGAELAAARVLRNDRVLAYNPAYPLVSPLAAPALYNPYASALASPVLYNPYTSALAAPALYNPYTSALTSPMLYNSALVPPLVSSSLECAAVPLALRPRCEACVVQGLGNPYYDASLCAEATLSSLY